MDKKKIRNFSIIAHIDHGKTTLTDRLLEFAGVIKKEKLNERMLDTHPIEKQRGITIKLAPVTMNYKHNGDNYQLNLIDTPGHVDFSYEVERSLAACEAAVLLIDASQGVQAQTVAHAYKAFDLDLKLLPILNKIDLDSANTSQVLKELKNIFGFNEDEVGLISAKTGEGIKELIKKIISDVPAPKGEEKKPLRALVFNSTFDAHLGVIAFVRIVDGKLDNNDQLVLMRSGKQLNVKEVGVFKPDRSVVDGLSTGEVGYIATGLKTIRDLKVGDTITTVNFNKGKDSFLTNGKVVNKSGDKKEKKLGRYVVEPLAGYKEPLHTVYADFYPAEKTDFTTLVKAVEELQLSDAALVSNSVYSAALGSGLRLGFLGLFHIEITKERLSRDKGVESILTNPTVEYKVEMKDGRSLLIQNPNELPSLVLIDYIEEPMVMITIMTPVSFIGGVIELIQAKRGIYKNTIYSDSRAQLIYRLPLSELISGFFDDLKSVSQGFATLDYEVGGYDRADVVKLEVLLNYEKIKPLARMVVKSKVDKIGRKLVSEIKELLPKQMFAVPIQSVVGGTVVARETKPAARKDVTAKLYGGDQSRKDKLLKKQKKGKKRMAKFGKVSIPDNIFTKLATL